MKTEKNYLTKLFKIGILFCGISLLLWNCEKEELNYNPNTNFSNSLLKIQNQFNGNEFKKALPYKFDVDWNNNIKKFHEELKVYYYEFPVIYKNSFNPNIIENSNNSNYISTYKLLAIEENKNQYTFYIFKNYTKNLEKNKFTKLNSFSEDEVINGFNHILDNEGKIVYAEKIIDGKKDVKIFIRENLKKKLKLSENNQQKMMYDCYQVYTYHYTDWYNVVNGVYYYHDTTYDGFSVEQVCESYWLPDLNIAGGGNSGGYYTNPGNSPVYQDCQSNNKSYQGRYVEESNPCNYDISVNTTDCADGYVYDPVLGTCVEITVENIPPDCESFNYSRVGTTNWQTAAVAGIHELFSVFNWQCTGFDFGVLPQAMYFQLPINSNFILNSGYTKN